MRKLWISTRKKIIVLLRNYEKHGIERYIWNILVKKTYFTTLLKKLETLDVVDRLKQISTVVNHHIEAFDEFEIH